MTYASRLVTINGMLKSVNMYIASLGKLVWALVATEVASVLGLAEAFGITSGVPRSVWWAASGISLVVASFVSFHRLRKETDATIASQSLTIQELSRSLASVTDAKARHARLGALLIQGHQLFIRNRALNPDDERAWKDWKAGYFEWRDETHEFIKSTFGDAEAALMQVQMRTTNDDQFGGGISLHIENLRRLIEKSVN